MSTIKKEIKYKAMTTHITPIASLKDNYIWAIINEKTRHVAIVDPGDALPVLDFLAKNQLKLAAILVTHHHWDHTNGIAGLLAENEVPVIGAAISHLTFLTDRVHDNENIHIDNIAQSFTALTIPGHTLDHVAFYAPGILFCGDTLFAAGCGRAFEGTPSQLFQSLQRMAALPENTNVFCAHEYTENNLRFAQTVEPANAAIKTRYAEVVTLRAKNLPTLPSMLKIEKVTNPFLRCEIPEVITAAEKYAGESLSNPAAVFAVLREWKNQF